MESPVDRKRPLSANDRANNEKWDWEDVYGRPGHMKSIRLMNFMCHDHFFFEFSPRVNVIHGENGSGKSAIITAVGLVFGLRAASTNRADKLEDVVKKGSNIAKIELEICNYILPETESRGYKTEQYGKIILIERLINSKGGGGFKIKNSATGKVISTRRSDVLEIAEHFRIKVENPATVLNQEVSKHFLNSKNPSDKYRFYMRATELENIKMNYVESNNSTKRQYDVFVQRMQILKRREKELDAIRAKYDTLKKFDQSRESIDDLKIELEWAKIHEQLGVLEKREMFAKEKDAELQRLQADKARFEERKEVFINDFEKKKDAQTAFEEERARLKAICDNLNGDSAIIKSDLKQSSINKKLQNNEVIKLQSLRQELEDNRSRALGENNSNYESELEKIEHDIQKTNIELVELKAEICDLKTPQELNEAAQNIEQLKNDWERQRGIKNALERSIHEMSTSTGNRQIYSKDMQEFIAQIERIKPNLQGPVYGPMAKYIKLKNQEHAPIVEKILRNSLVAFLVTNKRDFEMVMQIHNRIWRGRPDGPRIAHRQATAPIHLHGKTASYSFYNSLWELFTITEPNVANYIIDNHYPNTILFIPDSNKAYDEASRREFLHQAKNVRQILSQNGDSIILNPLRTYPGEDKDRYSKYLVSSNEDRLKYEKSKLEKNKEFLRQLEAEEKELSRALNNERQERVRKEKRKCGLSSELQTLGGRRQFLMEKIEQIRSTDFDEMERKIGIIDEKLESEKEALKELYEKVMECHGSYEKQQAKVDMAQREYNEHIDRNNFEALVRSFNDKLAKLERKIQETCAEVDMALERKAAAEENVHEEKEKLDKLKALAPATQEPENVRSVAILKKTIIDSETFLRVHKDIVHKADEIREDFHRCNMEHNLARKAYQECIELHNTFATATTKRKQALDSAKMITLKKVNWFFREFLKEKGMKGKIVVYDRDVPDPDDPAKILNRAETLHVIAQPMSTSKAHDYDSKSLSGGERSFSTVSFIVALWNVASTPFRILDEVDVFMDQITRRVCLEMLITFATNKSCDQFLFLSPLAIPDLEPSPKVKIFQMPIVKRH